MYIHKLYITAKPDRVTVNKIDYSYTAKNAVLVCTPVDKDDFDYTPPKHLKKGKIGNIKYNVSCISDIWISTWCYTHQLEEMELRLKAELKKVIKNNKEAADKMAALEF